MYEVQHIDRKKNLAGAFAIAIDSYFKSKSLNINREETEFEKA